MEQLLRYILESITTHPQDINISINESQYGFVDIKVTLHPEDMGKVIGKKGRVISAIRKLLKIRAIVLGKRYNLEVLDPQANQANPEIETDTQTEEVPDQE